MTLAWRSLDTRRKTNTYMCTYTWVGPTHAYVCTCTSNPTPSIPFKAKKVFRPDIVCTAATPRAPPHARKSHPPLPPTGGAGAPHSEPLRRGGGGRAPSMRPPRLGRPSLRGRGVGTEVPIARSDARAQARQPEREGVVCLGLRATYARCTTNPPPKVREVNRGPR